MEIKLCDEFFYRVKDDKDLFKIFNTSEENLIRNNLKIKTYNGEVIKIKINDYLVHYVKPMQSLSEIAKIYGVDEDEIVNENNLKIKKLFIGQRLKISIKKPL